LLLPGCRFEPFKNDLENDIQNQNGRIEDLKQNQNGIMAELAKIEQRTEITARDLKEVQTGMNNDFNSGIQILQGDVGIITIVLILASGITGILFFRNKAEKAEKVANLFAEEISRRKDLDLENSIFMSAMNTDIEKDVLKTIRKKQHMVGRIR
jgi:hypothetical protein